MNNINEAKNVDGIKKLSHENLAKSRKIVLDIIGEEVKENSAENQIYIKMNSGRTNLQKNENEKLYPVKPESSRQDLIDKNLKEKLALSKDKIFDALGINKNLNQQTIIGNPLTAGNKQNEPPKKDSEKQKTAAYKFSTVPNLPPQISGKKYSIFGQAPSDTSSSKLKNSNYAPNFKNIRPLADELSGEKKEKNQIIKTGFGILGSSGKKTLVETGINTRTEINEPKSSFFSKLLAKKKVSLGNPKKELREKKIKFDFSISKILSGLLNFLKKYLFSYFSLFFNVFFIFISLYIIFVFSVTALKLDNRLIRFINNYLPVPAIIYNKGVVNYFWYVDFIQKNLAVSTQTDLSPAAAKNFIFKEIIMLELAKKYNISANDYEDKVKFISDISKLMAYDTVINQVSINRINKIRKMIKTSDDFAVISEKYGDEQGEKNLTDTKLNELSYKLIIEKLNIGDISNVIIQPEGYYIFYCNFKNQRNTSLRYIFIKSVTLDDYLNEEIKNFKFINLVD